jgi:hypothetical protein
VHRREIKVFDPADGYAPLTNVDEMIDATLARHGDQWWMYLAGGIHGHPAIQVASASLPPGAPLAATGWRLTPEPRDPTKLAVLAEQTRSAPWDRDGGRHCPSYVKGWDPHRRQWVERIYYAGASSDLWGPYTIGYLERDGDRWVDQPAPVFVAQEPWERGSVYEPNLIYHDGLWKLWYVAGSNRDDYLVHGYAESVDGSTGWSTHQVFLPAEQKVFDFCVIEANSRFEAVLSRVWLGAEPAPATTGLYWCHAPSPSPRISDWSTPLQIMGPEDRGWHRGPWKPSFRYGDTDPTRLYVFFDGAYDGYQFTLGCLELDGLR